MLLLLVWRDDDDEDDEDSSLELSSLVNSSTYFGDMDSVVDVVDALVDAVLDVDNGL